MAFEGIDPGSLKSALNACIESLDNSGLARISSSTGAGGVWSCNAATVLRQALNTLSNTKYNDLKQQLRNYVGVADKIQEYKTLEAQTKQAEVKYQSLQGQIYMTVTRTYTNYQTHEEYQVEEQEVNQDVINELNRLANQININWTRLIQIANDVYNSL